MVLKSVVHRAVVTASPGNLLEMQILGPVSEHLGWLPAMSSLTSLLGDSDARWTLTPTGVAHCVSGQRRRKLVWLQAGKGQTKSGGVRCIKKHW